MTPADRSPADGSVFAFAFERLPDPTVLVAVAAEASTIAYANAAARAFVAAIPGNPARQLVMAGFGGSPAQATEFEEALARRAEATFTWHGMAPGSVSVRLAPIGSAGAASNLVLVTWGTDHARIQPPFGKLADHIPDPVFVLELESTPPARIAYVNHAATSTYGYSAEEMLGKSILELLDTPCTAQHAPDRLVRLRRGDIVTFEGRHRRKDGTEMPIEARACLVQWQGRPAILAIDRDLTARRRAADALEAAEERLRLALAAGSMGTFDWDVTTNRVVWSAFHYELFGYPIGDPAEVTFAHFQDRVHPEDWPGVQASIETARQSQGEIHHTARVLRPDGSVRWFSGRGRFHYSPGGEAVRMLGVVRDDTSPRESEARLRERERFLTAVIDGSPIAIQIFTTEGTSVRMNAAMQRLLGLPSRDVGVGVYNLLQDSEAIRTGLADNFRRCIAGETTGIERREIDFTAPTYAQWPLHRRRVWLDCVFFPMREPSGQVNGVVAFQWDVSDQVEAERARQRLEGQLRHAQKLEAVGLLAGGVAHDFNNVLTAVMGFSDLLCTTGDPNDPTYSIAEEIKRAAERGANLTRQLLSFSRKEIVRTEVIEPGDEVHTFAPMLRRLLEANIQFDIEATPAGTVRADKGQFQQVLLNLVVNARDAMPHGGRLLLTIAPGRLGADDDAVRISVRDNGTGMDDSVKAHLFEPFFTTKEPGRGTGLGLATVWGIVTQAGGRIEIESAPGQGSTFHVFWPRADAPLLATTTLAVPPTPARFVLLVEDDASNRGLAERILSQAGYHVQTAPDGETALVVAARHPHIDVLVTDVMMPGINGRQLAERMQQMRPGCRTVFMSGYTADELLRDGVARAEIAFLQKPYSADQLLRIVAAAVR